MWRAGAGLLLVLLACNAEERQVAEQPEAQLPPRPQTITDTLMLEGMAEPARAELVHSPEGVQPRFSTYLPAGLTMEGDARGDTAWVRFSASFTGPPDPNAYMHVRLYPRGINHAQAREVVNGFLRSRRPQDDPTGSAISEPPPHQPAAPPVWGLDAHTLSYRGDGGRQVVGRLVLGRRGDRFFHVLTHYPAEYGDGLGPRFERILHHWRWEDTGEMLQATARPQDGS